MTKRIPIPGMQFDFQGDYTYTLPRYTVDRVNLTEGYALSIPATDPGRFTLRVNSNDERIGSWDIGVFGAWDVAVR